MTRETQMTVPITPHIRAAQNLDRQSQLQAASHEIESQFLSAILNAVDLSTDQNSFSGGIGEEQFKSFLINAQAAEISKSGAIGLAEILFASLTDQGVQDE